MDSTSSAMASSSNTVLGCRGLGLIESTGGSAKDAFAGRSSGSAVDSAGGVTSVRKNSSPKASTQAAPFGGGRHDFSFAPRAAIRWRPPGRTPSRLNRGDR